MWFLEMPHELTFRKNMHNGWQWHTDFSLMQHDVLLLWVFFAVFVTSFFIVFVTSFLKQYMLRRLYGIFTSFLQYLLRHFCSNCYNYFPMFQSLHSKWTMGSKPSCFPWLHNIEHLDRGPHFCIILRVYSWLYTVLLHLF